MLVPMAPIITGIIAAAAGKRGFSLFGLSCGEGEVCGGEKERLGAIAAAESASTKQEGLGAAVAAESASEGLGAAVTDDARE